MVIGLQFLTNFSTNFKTGWANHLKRIPGFKNCLNKISNNKAECSNNKNCCQNPFKPVKIYRNKSFK